MRWLAALPAIVLIACQDNGPIDEIPPKSMTAHEFKMSIFHHALQGTSTTAQSAPGTYGNATNIWRSQCNIGLSHFNGASGTIKGVTENGDSVRLGERFAHNYASNGQPIPGNWTKLRDMQEKKDIKFNIGVDAFYSHYVYNGKFVGGVTQAKGFNRAVLLSAQHQSTVTKYENILPHELGHMLNLDDTGSLGSNQWIMDGYLEYTGPGIAGKQADGTFARDSECQRARQYGFRQQYFMEPWDGSY